MSQRAHREARLQMPRPGLTASDIVQRRRVHFFRAETQPLGGGDEIAGGRLVLPSRSCVIRPRHGRVIPARRAVYWVQR